MQRWIRERRVKVDGLYAKPSAILKAGQSVAVELPPPPPVVPLPEDLPVEVLHDDESIIVINKGPDMVVHPQEGTAAGGTLVNALLHRTQELSSEGGEFRPGIVHRLDRETSGVIVVARDDVAHRRLAVQFKERTVRKEYLAFVHGVPSAGSGEVDLPLGRSPTQRKKMTVRIDEEGKESLTRWERQETYLDRYCWLRVSPATGRTHQIRVHLKSIGHPILCDALYGREKQITASELAGRRPQGPEPPLLGRHALHAVRLGFRHPATDEWVEFEAPLPPDLAELWRLTTSSA